MNTKQSITLKNIASPENLLKAWTEFAKGKRSKSDVQEFSFRLMEHIFTLHRDLISKLYRHSPYQPFNICDPKQRRIHKATVRDRVLHHAIFKILNPVFEPTFIAHSFSCRIDKGTHKGVATLQKMLRKVSRNNRKPCFALKCDIQKFFDSVDHETLTSVLKERIYDKDAMWLLNEIIESYTSVTREREREREAKRHSDWESHLSTVRQYLYERI